MSCHVTSRHDNVYLIIQSIHHKADCVLCKNVVYIMLIYNLKEQKTFNNMIQSGKLFLKIMSYLS